VNEMLKLLEKSRLPVTKSFLQRCPNRLGEGQGAPECGTMWQIETDPLMRIRWQEETNPETKTQYAQDVIKNIRMSPYPETDRFWMQMAWKRVEQTLDSLDKRAEFMLTTIAALIAVDYGLLLAFDIPVLSINIFPQFLLAISAIFFSVSHFPRLKVFYPESPENVKETYRDWLETKFMWHSWGYSFFVLGLFAIGISYMIQPLGNPPDNVQTINGTLTVNIPNSRGE
jgi:hypothetical protein